MSQHEPSMLPRIVGVISGMLLWQLSATAPNKVAHKNVLFQMATSFACSSRCHQNLNIFTMGVSQSNESCTRKYELYPRIRALPVNMSCTREYELYPLIRAVPTNTSCIRELHQNQHQNSEGASPNKVSLWPPKKSASEAVIGQAWASSTQTCCMWAMFVCSTPALYCNTNNRNLHNRWIQTTCSDHMTEQQRQSKHRHYM